MVRPPEGAPNRTEPALGLTCVTAAWGRVRVGNPPGVLLRERYCPHPPPAVLWFRSLFAGFRKSITQVFNVHSWILSKMFDPGCTWTAAVGELLKPQQQH